MSTLTPVQTKLTEMLESALDSDLYLQCDFDNIDFYSVMCKAVSDNVLTKVMGIDGFIYKINDKEDEIVIIFVIPMNGKTKETNSNKYIPKKLMEIVNNCEKKFIKLDRIKVEEVKSDKYVYLKILKKLED